MTERTRPACAKLALVRAVLFPRRVVSRRARPGFSLIELVIVLVILTTLGAVASVRYAGAAATYRVEAAAARLSADLGLARQRAMSRATDVVFDLDKSAAIYRVRSRAEVLAASATSTTSVAGPIEVRLGDDPYHASISRMTSSTGQPRAVFDAFGSANADLSIEIRVGDRKRTVTLAGATGQATISP